MLKKILIASSLVSILAGPILYLSLVQRFELPGMPENVSLPGLDAADWLGPLRERLPATAQATPAQVYKWQDASGVWQFSGAPPASVDGVQSLTVVPNSSVQAFAGVPDAAAPPADGEPEAARSPALPVLPGRVQQLVEDARNVQTLLDARAGQIESAASR